MFRRTSFVVPALVLALAVHVSHAGDEEPASVTWVKAHAHPFKTVSAGSGFEDLAFLETALAGARVVGLGEGSHGTREHFQMKHRLMEFLATKMGFSVFAIEANMPEACRVDRYVSGGEGDPAKLIGGMYFWTWNTEEVLDMVRWMRDFNVREAAAKSGRHVRFAGFDMQMSAYSQTLVRRFVEKYDAPYAATLGDQWKTVSNVNRRSPFGCTSTLLPIDAVRGHKVRFQGWIRTRLVEGGWAGLWARVNVGKEVRFFDNMNARGPRGTTDWTSCTIEFDVAAEATAVQVGTVFSASGQAWFDDLAVEIDGKPCDAAAFPDGSFEEKELGPLNRGFSLEKYDPSNGVFTTERETGPGAKSGEKCLVMCRVAAPSAPVDGAKEAADAVLAHLTAGRQRFVDAGCPADDVEWAVQNARIVRQCMELVGTQESAVRDTAMAENVRWMLDREPDAKVVLWAHNYHVSGMKDWMGSRLKKALGPKYVDVGFMAGSGTYYAMDPQNARTDHVFQLEEPVESSVEWIFRRTGMPFAVLDLRSADKDAPGAAWTLGKVKFGGTIGAMRADQRFEEIDVREAFDLLLYVDKTSAARQLATSPAFGPPDD